MRPVVSSSSSPPRTAAPGTKPRTKSRSPSGDRTTAAASPSRSRSRSRAPGTGKTAADNQAFSLEYLRQRPVSHILWMRSLVPLFDHRKEAVRDLMQSLITQGKTLVFDTSNTSTTSDVDSMLRIVLVAVVLWFCSCPAVEDSGIQINDPMQAPTYAWMDVFPPGSKPSSPNLEPVPGPSGIPKLLTHPDSRLPWTIVQGKTRPMILSIGNG